MPETPDGAPRAMLDIAGARRRQLAGLGVDEGLRDRKKRLMRDKISDTATALFIERGFDDVRVSEIAAACDVSEKTVFNYFPTKESLIFDREEMQSLQIVEALRDAGDGRSIVDSIVAVIDADLQWMYDAWANDPDPAKSPAVIGRFTELIENTPALTAAMFAMGERLTQVAAEALAARAGVDPDDPEPQIAAGIVLGLWQTEYRALRRYSDGSLGVDEMFAAIRADIHRAAAVADGGLSSFNAVVDDGTDADADGRDADTDGSGNADQMRAAAEAADTARQQVVAAVKQARQAWRLVMAEVQRHHAEGDHHQRHADRHRTKQEIMAQKMEMRNEIRRFQQEIRQRQAEEHRLQEAKRRQRRGRST